jgi:histidinol phosphatase-like PHP family hydrolase
MNNLINRRAFLRRSTAVCAISAMPSRLIAATNESAGVSLDFPLSDLHIHLDNSTIEKVLELPAAHKVKFGVVEHAGTKENKYPVVLSNDAELKARNTTLEGKPVYKGIQAEWTDWMGCFSPEALAQLDFVLTDAMTYPGKDGQRVKLWEPRVEEWVDMRDKQEFMDRYVAWHVEILSKQPIDILANVSWLPASLAADYEKFWTPARMQKVLEAAVKFRVAIEISSSFKLPRLAFLRAAKAAGAKFCFGSNGRYPAMGQLDYSVQMAQELGLAHANIFAPAPDGQKAVQRRLKTATKI